MSNMFNSVKRNYKIATWLNPYESWKNTISNNTSSFSLSYGKEFLSNATGKSWYDKIIYFIPFIQSDTNVTYDNAAKFTNDPIPSSYNAFPIIDKYNIGKSYAYLSPASVITSSYTGSISENIGMYLSQSISGSYGQGIPSGSNLIYLPNIGMGIWAKIKNSEPPAGDNRNFIDGPRCIVTDVNDKFYEVNMRPGGAYISGSMPSASATFGDITGTNLKIEITNYSSSLYAQATTGSNLLEMWLGNAPGQFSYKSASLVNVTPANQRTNILFGLQLNDQIMCAYITDGTLTSGEVQDLNETIYYHLLKRNGKL